ncbi:MAG: AMIN domain-containing protein, partial [Sulfurimonas sp.]|nr:AMIN domain-containing protein [Sulfurimonas sp.]
LKRATITLPAQARILQKVTIEFKNLDGSLESKSIELDNSVDWHLPIFVSQSYSTMAADTTTSKPQKKTKQKIKYNNIASIKHLKLYSSGKKLKLITNDKIKRDFLLVNPHRIVIDFKKDTDIKSYIKKSPKNIFREVRIGNHKGYYRVVIELDGHYRYNSQKISNGYLIELR